MTDPARGRAKTESLSFRALSPWLLLAGLLFFVPAVTSMRTTSATFDEPVYIVAGVAYATLHDFTMKDDAPPLVGYLAGAAAHARGLTIPGRALGFRDSFGHEYPYATRVLYAPGTDAAGIVRAARLWILVPFGLLLLGTVFLWSRERFGPRAGIFSVLLAALCPNLVAHGGLVAADFPCATTMLLASYLFGRALAAPSPSRWIAAGLALGLALLTKFTALILLPAFVLTAGVWAFRGPWPRGGSKGAALRGLALMLAPAALCVLFAYGWPPDPGRYAAGVHRLYRNVNAGYTWYLFGRFYKTRPILYYAVVLCVKATVPLLVLGIGSLFLIRGRRDGLLAELCLLLPAGLLLIASSAFGASVGIRNVLPVLPVLAVSAGRWIPARGGLRRKGTAFAAALLVWHAASSLPSWPHYIPYFNEAAGRQGNGARLLDDSNIDWGQDLASLPAVLTRLGADRVNLYYFGTADPAWYGIPVTNASLEKLARPEPGYYAISVTYVIRMRQAGILWPSERTPVARAGTSILVYRID